MERTPISLSNVKGNTEGASLAFAGESTLKFDASSLSANALFTAEGKQGKLTATDAKVNIEASNLSWGRYYLFENFDTEGVTKENFVTEDGKLVAADKWSEQLKAPGMGIELDVDEKGNVSVVVGSDSVEGSDLHVNAKNLVSAIFKGDRASGEDLAFVNEDKATIFEVPVGLAVKTPTFMFQTFKVQPYADVTVRGRFGDTESSYMPEGSKTTDTIDYDVAGKFVGDLKVGYMSTYKDLNLGMSYSLSAGDAGRQNHTLELTMRVDF